MSSQRASDTELWCFFCSWPERTVGQSRCRLFETPWCSCDATVMGMDKSLSITYWWMFCNCHSRALYDTILHWTVLKRLLRASQNYKHPPQHIAGGWTDKIATVLPCSVSTIQNKNTYYIYCNNHCLQWPWDRSTFRMSYRSVRNRIFFFKLSADRKLLKNDGLVSIYSDACMRR